eukprot:SAG31_NODE_3003_length_4795_cov_4.386499_2_plen_79_part_00
MGAADRSLSETAHVSCIVAKPLGRPSLPAHPMEQIGDDILPDTNGHWTIPSAHPEDQVSNTLFVGLTTKALRTNPQCG